MDADTVDRDWNALQQQAQQTAQMFQTLAGKLQAAAAAGDQNAREWLLDLKEAALSVHQEEAQAAQVMQSVHALVDNHVNQVAQIAPAGYPQQQYPAQPQYQPQPGYPQPGYAQPQPGYPQQYPQQGGGMLHRFLGSSFGSAMAMGAGFGIGDDIINDIFR
ncbi:hypothetical protein KO481_23550 [Nocardia sp. NEAU-G5]|uniref:PPE family domain-containing protein n=1 Tax=Nocardia albiluteola TaxID=2842303 RepID=A0ABS6B512_9NOCA|nr:hypothetical protein [Nocardia albiluteola]MBU3064496.1 hypothetical protein [Nocardia albiluteola]